MNVSTSRSERNGAIEGAMSSPTAVSTPMSPSASLLPDPGAGGLDGVQDAMSMMYELVAKQGQSTMATGEDGVTSATKTQQADSQQQAAALKQQEADEAKANSGGGLFGEICNVFSDIGRDLEHGDITDIPVDAVSDTVNIVDNPNLLSQLEQLAPQVAEYVGVAAAVVGAAALTGATAGTAGIVVAAVVIGLSASGMVAEKTHCFGAASAYIGMGLEVAGAITSFGASSAMVADSAMTTASAAVDAASGTSDVLAGASTIVVGHEQAAVVDDTADVQQATMAINRNARLVSDIVAGLKSAQQSNTNALQALAGASQTYGQTLTLASAAKA